jgi:hypothetical protein
MITYLANQLQEKNEAYQARESEIVSLKHELERSSTTKK